MERESKVKIWEIIPTLGGGGAEKMVLDLSADLKERGYIVTVLSLYNQEYASENRLRFVESHGICVRYLGKKPGLDLHLLRKLIKMIRTEKPDIIHTHLGSFQYLAVAGKLFRFNHIHTMHSVIGKEPKVYQHLLRSASRRGKTHFVVLSNKIGDKMKQVFGTDDAYITCIPNGVDRSVYLKKNRSFHKGAIRFIAVGSLIPVKNHALLINAFARMQEDRDNTDTLIILGEGILRKELEEQISRLGLCQCISLPGNVDSVLIYLNEADVYVMPSHFEGVSFAMLEAASTGLPIITTRTGNIPEVVLDGAIMIDDNDEDALYKEMKRIAVVPEYRREYAKRALKIADRFDKRKMINDYIALYSKVLGQ